MWMLHWLPDSFLKYFILGMVFVGAGLFVLGLITKWIPLMGRHALVSRAVGLVLLLPGLYFWGGYGVEMEYRAAAEEWKKKLAIAEEKAEKANKEIETKIKVETQVIRQDTEETIYLIEQLKSQINKQGCELSPEAIEIYNEGMTGRQ